jgi:hypothetical protein
MADQSGLRRAADICVSETDLPGGQYGMVEEFNEKLIEKVWEYVFLYGTGHLEYKNLVMVVFAQACHLLIDFVHPPLSAFSFTTHC